LHRSGVDEPHGHRHTPRLEGHQGLSTGASFVDHTDARRVGPSAHDRWPRPRLGGEGRQRPRHQSSVRRDGRRVLERHGHFHHLGRLGRLVRSCEALPPGPAQWLGKGFTYGFRVPLLVVSAYTPAGFVDNADHDSGSLLKFIEMNFESGGKPLGLIGPGFTRMPMTTTVCERFSR